MNGDLRHDLMSRFGEDFQLSLDDARAERLEALASHRVQRDFLDTPIDHGLLKALCACALSAPSKSDLQQRDLVIVEDPDLRRKVGALMPTLSMGRERARHGDFLLKRPAASADLRVARQTFSK